MAQATMQPLLDAALASHAPSAELARYATYWDTRIALTLGAVTLLIVVTLIAVRIFWVTPLVRALRERF